MGAQDGRGEGGGWRGREGEREGMAREGGGRGRLAITPYWTQTWEVLAPTPVKPDKLTSYKHIIDNDE